MAPASVSSVGSAVTLGQPDPEKDKEANVDDSKGKLEPTIY